MVSERQQNLAMAFVGGFAGMFLAVALFYRRVLTAHESF